MTNGRPALTREAIIEVARRIVSRDGLDALALRPLAKELGVTAPALYLHVRDKDDLLAALAESGFEELFQRCNSVDSPDPMERIRRWCVIYVDIALEEPGLFRVMFRFRPGALDLAAVNELPAATKAFEQPVVAIAEAIDNGTIHRDHNPMLVALTMWTVAHGLAGVMLLGAFPKPSARAALQDSVIGAMLHGLGHPPGA
ncbi:MAG: TetR/AcrR family transcriptional regulator [Acidimicrobiales bacterium]